MTLVLLFVSLRNKSVNDEKGTGKMYRRESCFFYTRERSDWCAFVDDDALKKIFRAMLIS